MIKEVIETTIEGNRYMHANVNQWTNGIVESCLASLTKLQKPFKYIVTCVIMQKMALAYILLPLATGITRLMEAVQCSGKTRPCTASSLSLESLFRSDNILMLHLIFIIQ